LRGRRGRTLFRESLLTMTLEIPENIEEEFLNFLDIAQASFTEEDVDSFTDQEKECIKFIESILGTNKSGRFPRRKDLQKARDDLNLILKQ
jgi:hypothetical protein